MGTKRLTTKTALVAAAGAVMAMGALTAGCGSTAKEEPTTPPPAESTPMVAPSEKAVRPGGDNSFSPTINPKPPGAVCKEVVNGVCIR